MKALAGFVVAMLWLSVIAPQADAQNVRALSIQGCVDVAKTAARAEYKLDSDTRWLKEFHDAFCDEVHRRQSKADKLGVSIPVGKIVIPLNVSSETLDEFDRNYCRATSSLEQFSQSTKVWNSVATPGVQAELTKCIKTALESGKNQGLSVETKVIDACHFNIIASYRRTAPGNAATATLRKPVLVSATCTAPSGALNEAAQTIACKRTTWGPAEVTFDTSQGPIIATLDAPNALPKPVFQAVPDVDTKNDSFSINKHSLYPCTKDMGDNQRRICNGTWTLPDAAGTIIAVKVPPENCAGGDACRYAWPSASFNDRVVKWTIDYNTKSDLEHRFDVTYTKPHPKTEAEMQALAQHAEAMRRYDEMMANSPCFVPPATPKPKAKAATSKG